MVQRSFPTLNRMPNVRAILFGSAVDIGGSFFVTSGLAALWGRMLQLQGVPTAKIHMALSASLMYSTTSFAVTTGFSFLGGYVAALLARHNHLAYGLAASMPCVVLGLFPLVGPYPSPTLASLATDKLIAVMASVAGAYWAMKGQENAQ
jgi:hypothetical protein